MITPSQQQSDDQERRAKAQARRSLISKWAPNIPAGYIHVDDAIEYMKRRWGGMIRAQMYEAFSRDDTGPRYVIMGDWPDASRGERYYMFEDIDLWVYRTKTGVPAAWRDIRKLPPNQRSTVPVLMLDGDEYGKEQSNVRRRLEEDGRGRVETPSTENNDGRETSDGGDRKSGNGVSPAAPDGRG